MALNPKQIKFCELFVQTGNATQSYLRAGYKAKTDTSAQANSSRMLLNDMVQAHIRDIQSMHSNDIKIDTQKIIKELAKIAFDDISDIVSIDRSGMVTVRDGADLTRLEAISTSNSSSNKSISIKFRDKLKALDMLCKILGVYDQHQKSTSQNLAVHSKRVLESLERLREHL